MMRMERAASSDKRVVIEIRAGGEALTSVAAPWIVMSIMST